MNQVNPPRALLSVYDKTGIVAFADALVTLGWEIISSGGTAQELINANIPVTEVSEITQSPEMLEGRVKTLHPLIHGGILADRSNPNHLTDLKKHGITAKTKMFKDCEHRIPVEGSSLGLEFLKKNLL